MIINDTIKNSYDGYLIKNNKIKQYIIPSGMTIIYTTESGYNEIPYTNIKNKFSGKGKFIANKILFKNINFIPLKKSNYKSPFKPLHKNCVD